MRTVALIVVLGLVAFASAITFKAPKPFKIDAAAIENQPRKQTVTFTDLVNFFQTHDFQQNDQLNEFLDNLIAEIQREHADHLALYTSQREDLAREFAFREREIADAQESLESSQAHLRVAQDEQARAANNADIAAQTLSIKNQELDNLRTARAAEVALFQERSQNLEYAIAKINQAFALLDEFEQVAENGVPASLIQTVNALLAITVRNGHSHKILPVYNKLLQAHAKEYFDINDIREVRELFSDILSNTESSLAAIREEEDNNARNFADREASLTETISKLTAQYNDSIGYLNRLHVIIEQETSISIQASGKIERNTDLLRQAHQLGDDCDAEFQQGESTRRNQLELLVQLRSAVHALEAEYHESLLPNIGDLINVE